MKTIYRDYHKNEKEVIEALEKANSLIYNQKTKELDLFYHEGLIAELYNVDDMNIRQLAINLGINIVTII